MKISVTFRNTEGDDWHKAYVDERLQKLKKYIDNPVDAHVVLAVEKFRNVAEINLKANGLNVNAKEEAKEMHLAIDEAIDKIETQLKKHKERIRGHKNNNNREEMLAEGGAEEAEEAPGVKVVETRKMVLEPMSMDDALLEMETTRNKFIIYRDSSTESVSLLYRRDDGKYALIETNS
ncbi:MAG: ribosome-associated translation inhibitor RaiA [Smithellaceae bacterium]|nr:ribosome-associated translation inhibitor RaiA [Smithellaceae bacterium]